MRLGRAHKSYEQQIDFYKEKIRLLINKQFAAQSDSAALLLLNEMELLSEVSEEDELNTEDDDKGLKEKKKNKPRKRIPDRIHAE